MREMQEVEKHWLGVAIRTETVTSEEILKAKVNNVQPLEVRSV